MTTTTTTTTHPSPPVSASTITKSTLDTLLLRYDALLAKLSTSKPDLLTLDHLRYTTIPHRLAARKQAAQSNDGKGGAASGAYLEKAEVEDLVRWKLTHGTFRPRLTQLVASNPASSIRDTTRRAYAIYAGGDGRAENEETYMSAIKTLSTLKGIGPATASLLLAVYDPARVPFFADELYLWVCCGGEWGRRKGGIGYTVGEYRGLWEGVGGVLGRLGGGVDGVGAVELERGAWVLGWEARDKEGGGGGKGRGRGKKGRVQGAGKREEEEVGTEPATKKRKLAEGLRVDGEIGPDDERDSAKSGDAVPSSPPTPNPPNQNLTTSASTSNRPIPPPPNRQPPTPAASTANSTATENRQLRRSNRTKRS